MVLNDRRGTCLGNLLEKYRSSGEFLKGLHWDFKQWIGFYRTSTWVAIVPLRMWISFLLITSRFYFPFVTTNLLKHIVCCLDSELEASYNEDISVLRIQVADSIATNIAEHFKNAINFIHSARSRGGLSHFLQWRYSFRRGSSSLFCRCLQKCHHCSCLFNYRDWSRLSQYPRVFNFSTEDRKSQYGLSDAALQIF